MTVIAMTREMGTLGKEVAAELASQLGLEVVHNELVEQHVAERMDLGESAVHRFLEGQPSLWERWNIDSRRLSRFTAEEILRLATADNVVIRGWGAAQLLRDVQHVVCVRVCAPMSKRVEEMARRLGVGDEEIVEREIRRNDEAHTRTIQRQTGLDWRDPDNYDIVLNTGFVPVATCVALLRQLAESPAYQPTEASRTKLRDKLIQSQAQALLREGTSSAQLGGGLDVKVEKGAITISGVIAGEADLDRTLKRLRTIEGVTDVRDNVTRLIRRYGP